MKPWARTGRLACAAISGLGLLVAIALGGVLLVQQSSLEPEERRLVQPTPLAGAKLGRVVLSLSSAAVTVKAGPAGGGITVESNFDPEVHQLEQSFDDDGAGGWTYRLDFHETSLFHVAVAGVWLGRRSPEVTIEIPRDLPLALEAKMEGGFLAVDLAGLELTTASVELDRGVLGVVVSEPLRIPMERLSVKGKMGTMVLRSLGNASPRELELRHAVGAALVDLRGGWMQDAEVDLQVAFGESELRLPRDVTVEGVDGERLAPLHPDDPEIPAPTLRVSRHCVVGDIRVVD